MHKLAALAVVTGLLAASCSGRSGSTLPHLQSSGSAPSTQGTRSVRPMTAVTAPVGWSATGTGAIAPANASDLGALDATRPIEVVLGLQLRNVDALNASIAAGTVISHDAFVAQYGPTSDQVASAVSYLQSNGFTDVSVAPNNLLVTATAPAAAVQKAFSTTLHAFSLAGGTYYANTQPAFVPNALGGTVAAVLGLTNVPGVKPAPKLTAASGVQPGGFSANGTPQPTACTKNVNQTTGTAVCPRFYDPATYSITYDAANTPTAANTGVAIFTAGNVAGAIADFRDNESHFGLP